MTAREPRDLHNWEDLHNVSILTFSTAGVFQHNPSPDNKRSRVGTRESLEQVVASPFTLSSSTNY